MSFNIDITIFIVFLAVNLVVGLRYGRGVKTIKDYALGGRNFSTGALVSTIVATWVTGSVFFIILSEIYSGDILAISITFCAGLQLIIIGYFLSPRMGEFLGALSVAEALGKLYGTNVRIITAISGIIGSMGLIAVQFKAFGSIFSYFLGFPSNIAVIAAGAIVTIYSTFGGIRAVTFTDVLQFITFGFAIPLVGILIWNQLYSIPGFSIENAFLDPRFDYKLAFNFNNPKLWELLPLMIIFVIPSLKPGIFQRISMGKNIKQVKKAFIISAIITVLMELSMAWIPFLIFNVNPSLKENQLLGYIIDNYTYPGLKGLIIIAITAMAMSTADSHINASSVLFSYDFFYQLRPGSNKNLLLSRIFSFLLGCAAIVLALWGKDFLTIVLTASSFYSPIVTVPFLMTILGFRSTEKSVLISMGAGFITVVLWKILGLKLNDIIFAMLVNLTFLMGSHYLLKQPGGWVGVRDMNYLNMMRANRKRKIANLINAIKDFSFIQFCKQTAPKNELMYMGLGIYCILYTFTTIYSTQVELLKENGRIILTIYQIMMITGVTMAMYPIWPPRIKKEIIVQIGWNIVIFYMLIFFSCFMVMVSDFGQLQFTVFSLNIVTTAILIGWKLGLGMALVGFYLSTEFYKYYAGIDNLDFALGSPQFIFMYMLMLAGSTLIIFLKPKEEYIKVTENKIGTLETEVTHLGHEVINLSEKVIHYSERVSDQAKEIERLGATTQKILNNVNHELRMPIGNVINFSDMLHQALQKSDNKLIKELSKEVYDNSNRVSSMILNMLDLATLDVKKVDLQKKTINFSELVEDRVKTCHKIYLGDKKINFELTIDPEVMVAVDPNYIRQTVDNLVINAISFSSKGLIKVSVSKQKGQVIFTITDQGKGIPPLELTDIFTPFKMGSNTESKAHGRGVGLALCKSAVEAHGGSIAAESNGKVGATVRFVLPI